uniref:Uncharacterized protein n=1 Tax=Triticum urartu TaxID=4572 RepID=A0A8R7U4K1_TRIUA
MMCCKVHRLVPSRGLVLAVSGIAIGSLLAHRGQLHAAVTIATTGNVLWARCRGDRVLGLLPVAQVHVPAERLVAAEAPPAHVAQEAPGSSRRRCHRRCHHRRLLLCRHVQMLRSPATPLAMHGALCLRLHAVTATLLVLLAQTKKIAPFRGKHGGLLAPRLLPGRGGAARRCQAKPSLLVL